MSTLMSELCSITSQILQLGDDMLRECLICRVKDEHIQHHLLLEDKLTLQKVTELALDFRQI